MTSHIEFSVDIVVYSIWENTNVQSESLCNVAYHFVYYIGFWLKPVDLYTSLPLNPIVQDKGRFLLAV